MRYGFLCESQICVSEFNPTIIVENVNMGKIIFVSQYAVTGYLYTSFPQRIQQIVRAFGIIELCMVKYRICFGKPEKVRIGLELERIELSSPRCDRGVLPLYDSPDLPNANPTEQSGYYSEVKGYFK